jgi:hypothetical protein
MNLIRDVFRKLSGMYDKKCSVCGDSFESAMEYYKHVADERTDIYIPMRGLGIVMKAEEKLVLLGYELVVNTKYEQIEPNGARVVIACAVERHGFDVDSAMKLILDFAGETGRKLRL